MKNRFDENGMYISQFKKESEIKEESKDIGYKGYFTIREENGKFILYVYSGGSKLPEWYKEFDDKKSALKEFTNILDNITKGYNKI